MLHAIVPQASRFVLLALLVAMTAACAKDGTPRGSDAPVQEAAGRPADSSSTPPPYAFDRPEARFELPRELKEISGLTVLDDAHLGAIEDEGGRLYVIDIETGQVVDDKKFDKGGDYEAVERVDDRVFVLRSDGTLYEIKDWRAADLDVEKHKTGLDAKHDTEGLAYDAARRRLLIACKEYPGKGMKGKKAIYAFDLAAQKLIEEPAYTIDVDAFNRRTYAEEHAINRTIREAVQPVLDLSGFKPSALAVHPLTDQLYVLSSVQKAIVVLDADGSLQHVWPLPEDDFAQPEGLAFLPSGDLFIASEAGGGKALLKRFALKQ